MKIGDLYTHGGKAYIVKAYHPNPKRILLYDASDGRVFSILPSKCGPSLLIRNESKSFNVRWFTGELSSSLNLPQR